MRVLSTVPSEIAGPEELARVRRVLAQGHIRTAPTERGLEGPHRGRIVASKITTSGKDVPKVVERRAVTINA